MKQSEADFRKQFQSDEEYQRYLKTEMGGSPQTVREKIKRSLLIEQVLKSDVQDRSVATWAEVRAYYDKNPARFQMPESYAFQSVSVIPPQNSNVEQQKAGLSKANQALAQAKNTKSFEEFGLLAEKISEDDFRVNMGDHKVVMRDNLPPQVVKALASLKPGQVSGLIQIEQAYTIVRLNAHMPAAKRSFEQVKGDLKTELQKQKYEKLRSGLDKRLRAQAKVELL